MQDKRQGSIYDMLRHYYNDNVDAMQCCKKFHRVVMRVEIGDNAWGCSWVLQGEAMAGAWQLVAGIVERGHQVASGRGRNNPYGAGTIALQIPCFKARGLDLSGYVAATINVSIAPRRFQIQQPAFFFAQVDWTNLHPPEDFSFARCRLVYAARSYAGLVYYPHPETKVQHFQSPAVLEILAPPIADLTYGATVELALHASEITLLED